MGKRINYRENLQLISDKINKTPTTKVEMFNLSPNRKLPTDQNLWLNEIQTILQANQLKSEMLNEVIVETVLEKLALVGDERDEIGKFLKFYLDCDPTLLDKLE